MLETIGQRLFVIQKKYKIKDLKYMALKENLIAIYDIQKSYSPCS
tara:strand:- start:722 stop:856 length:135 start_codon:yes stop_codon:yes gene_type:complete